MLLHVARTFGILDGLCSRYPLCIAQLSFPNLTLFSIRLLHGFEIKKNIKRLTHIIISISSTAVNQEESQATSTTLPIRGSNGVILNVSKTS